MTPRARGRGFGLSAKALMVAGVLCSGLAIAEFTPAVMRGEAGKPEASAATPLQAAAAATVSGTPAGSTRLYWGQTHLHTSYSTDAYGGGNTTIDPELAFRYARGLPVIHPTTHARARIERPLDFMLVTDHSDFLALQLLLDRNEPSLVGGEVGKRLRELQKGGGAGGVMGMIARGGNGDITMKQVIDAYAPVRNIPWFETIDAAERNNIPGKFTAFAGWEWSSTPDGRNLHRNIFTPAPAEKLRKFVPFSNVDSERPEDLWAWLKKQSEALDIDFVAIPHNSNMSDGLMFQSVDSDGRPITADYARTRSRWEREVEVTQIKGTSEASPLLSPSDEFANFEIYNGRFARFPPRQTKADFARYALMLGLKLEQDVGVNPYKLGMVGGSDIHVGLASTEEDDFVGATARDALPEQRNKNRSGNNFAVWALSASGLTGAWASENTRNGIFAAFKRKEVYATTGTRLQLRVFGGFDFQPGDANAADLAKVGYARGVPMGGDLTAAPAGKAPELLIRAVKDPAGANLDRIQVVKGWLDKRGETREQVFDVAWSGARKRDGKGRLPPVGDTVDLSTARYANTIGAPQLAVVWKDPTFDRSQRAFYYVRVLEIPTPRQQVYDAVALGLSPEEIRKIGVPTSIQERGYASPIWYTPARR